MTEWIAYKLDKSTCISFVFLSCNYVYIVFQISAGKAESIFIPIVASIVGTMDIIVKAQSTLAADRVKRQLIVEVIIIV